MTDSATDPAVAELRPGWQQGRCERTASLISHAGRCTTLPIPSLTVSVSLATSFAALVTAISLTVRLATDYIAATGTAVALAAITTHADSEHSATLRPAAHLQTKDGFNPADCSPHFGIMPDLMIGRMTLPAAG